MLTACGIETETILTGKGSIIMNGCNSAYRLRYWNIFKTLALIHLAQKVATVLTACGIETKKNTILLLMTKQVATVLTACGIETRRDYKILPVWLIIQLQQCLPLAVLKRHNRHQSFYWHQECCNSAYRLRYWNEAFSVRVLKAIRPCCNSAYRLRYWNSIHLRC